MRTQNFETFFLFGSPHFIERQLGMTRFGACLIWSVVPNGQKKPPSIYTDDVVVINYSAAHSTPIVEKYGTSREVHACKRHERDGKKHKNIAKSQKWVRSREEDVARRNHKHNYNEKRHYKATTAHDECRLASLR